MIHAGDALCIGGGTEGPASRARTARRDGAAAPDPGGLLQVVSAEGGKMRGRTQLPSPPVWDGLAAAAGRLYVSLEDGSVVCLAAGRTR